MDGAYLLHDATQSPRAVYLVDCLDGKLIIKRHVTSPEKMNKNGSKWAISFLQMLQ
jgi:hypothetical protein